MSKSLQVLFVEDAEDDMQLVVRAHLRGGVIVPGMNQASSKCRIIGKRLLKIDRYGAK